ATTAATRTGTQPTCSTYLEMAAKRCVGADKERIEAVLNSLAPKPGFSQAPQPGTRAAPRAAEDAAQKATNAQQRTYRRREQLKADLEQAEEDFLERSAEVAAAEDRIKEELRQHPLGTQRGEGGGANKPSLPIGALLGDDDLKVDMGELLKLGEEDAFISAEDIAELEARKANFAQEAKQAAKQAFAAAATKPKEQRQREQEFLEELRAKKKRKVEEYGKGAGKDDGTDVEIEEPRAVEVAAEAALGGESPPSDYTGEERELPWQLQFENATSENRIARRRPPAYMQDAVAYQFCAEGARSRGQERGGRAQAVQEYYITPLSAGFEEQRNYRGCGQEVKLEKVAFKPGIDVKADWDQPIQWRGTLAPRLAELQRCEGKGPRASRLENLRGSTAGTAPLNGGIGNRAEAKEALVGYATWAQGQEATGAGKLQRTTRDQPRRDNEIRIGDRETRSMADYMDAKGAQWAAKWRSQTSREQLLNALELARRLLKRRKQLVRLIMDVETRGTLPWQLMVTLVSLLRQDTGGDRSNGLLPEVVKLWSKTRGEYTNERVVSMARKWGAAVAGNSALKEAVVRPFADEVFERAPQKMYAATVLCDLAKVFGWGCRRALCTLIEMLNRRRSRSVREKPAYAEPVEPEMSICAGARRGIIFGRFALCASLKKVRAKCQQVCVKSWVDDVTARTEGSKAKLALSRKSAAIGKGKEVTQEIAPRLRSRNITASLKEQAPDLGIDRGSIAKSKFKRARRVAHADRQ
ncbi:unnamed protein product, partial [Prorocentrum cordatum]